MAPKTKTTYGDKEPTLKEIREFMGIEPDQFTKEWKALTAEDKAEIKELVADSK